MFYVASPTISITSFLHEDGALICKCNGILHEFVSAHFALSIFQSELHSSSIVLCNLPQIKSLAYLNTYFQQSKNRIYAFTIIQQWPVLRMQ